LLRRSPLTWHHDVTHRFTSQALKALSVAGAALVAATVLPAATSHAAPPKTTAQAQAQIDQFDNQAEVASEQYNGAQIRLTTAKLAAAAASAAAAKARTLVTSAQQQVGELAADSYRSGGAGQQLAVVLTDQSPATAIAKMAMLQQLSSEQAAVLTQARTADASYQQALAASAQATANAQSIAAALAKAQRQINAALAHSKQVLAQLTAEQRAQLAAAQRAADAASAAAAARATRALPAVRTVPVAASRSAIRTTPVATPLRAVPASLTGSSVAARAVAAALSRLGRPYVFGAAGPNRFDCSGLVEWAYGRAGVATAHYTGALWNAYRHISASALRPGDLVFFYSDHHHVGIYIGGGMMINAPHTGDVVRIVSVAAHGHFSGAVRVVG
jgi:cell wall-associated NlpC family hydrolase